MLVITYTYDILGRPTARNLARYGTQTSDTFGYNTRSESPRWLGGGLDKHKVFAPKGRAGNGVPASQLTTAHVNSADYSYAYDAIGNRAAAVENSSGVASRTEYRTNNLNQYTAEGTFRPTFDADGNQTLIKTSTGIWSVTYNAQNRPVLFTKSDGSVTVECTYDTMGRRTTKKVTTNGTLTEHRRFLYRGYLQIACCDLTRAYTPALWLILWDSTQPTATRPLAIQKNGTWYTYGWDLTKNICETYRTDGRIDLAYTYTPYGEVTPAHTYDQPLRWSSEYHDTELGLVYYNYRHYNPEAGRWTARELFFLIFNLYRSFANYPNATSDFIGNWDYNYNYIAEAKIKQFSSEEDFKKGEEIAYIFKRDRNDISAYYTGFTRANSYDKLHTIKKREEFDPNEDCKSCISLLTIYAHGKYESGYAYLNVGNDKELMESEDGKRKGISGFFNKKNINFCKKAVLNIRSCTIGNVKRIKREIRNYYKTKGIDLTVNTYEDFIWPSGSPNWAYYTVIGVIKLSEGACAIKG